MLPLQCRSPGGLIVAFSSVVGRACLYINGALEQSGSARFGDVITGLGRGEIAAFLAAAVTADYACAVAHSRPTVFAFS